MKEKNVLYYEIGDFYVEAEESYSGGERTVEFWLSRKDYGIKAFMFGLPWSEVPEGKLENVFAEYLVLFTDRGYMDPFFADFLEDEEVDEYFNVVK